MEKFEIVMLGNTSAGKTSMLAVLTKEIRKINNVCGVSFTPCGDTTAILDETWGDLTDQIASSKPFQPIAATLDGTTDYIPYHFELCLKGESQAKVDFIDTKGGFIRDVDGSGLLEKTKQAVGAFCVIDAAVMMECDAATNRYFNRPGLVADLFGKVFACEEHPKFVAFVLTKCETYMQTAEDIEKLQTRFHEVFSESIELLQKKRINSYAMAIQTLGCVWFKDLVETRDERGKELKLPRFKKKGSANQIESRDCEIPLIVTMKNLLWTMKNREGVFDWLLNILGLGKGLENYIQQLNSIGNLGDAGRYYEELASDF